MGLTVCWPACTIPYGQDENPFLAAAYVKSLSCGSNRAAVSMVINPTEAVAHIMQCTVTSIIEP